LFCGQGQGAAGKGLADANSKEREKGGERDLGVRLWERESPTLLDGPPFEKGEAHGPPEKEEKSLQEGDRLPVVLLRGK